MTPSSIVVVLSAYLRREGLAICRAGNKAMSDEEEAQALLSIVELVTEVSRMAIKANEPITLVMPLSEIERLSTLSKELK